MRQAVSGWFGTSGRADPASAEGESGDASGGAPVAGRGGVGRRRPGAIRVLAADLVRRASGFGRREQRAAGVGPGARSPDVARLDSWRRDLLRLRTAAERDRPAAVRGGQPCRPHRLGADLPDRRGLRRGPGRDRQPRPGQGGSLRGRRRGAGRAAAGRAAGIGAAGGTRPHRDLGVPAAVLPAHRPRAGPAVHGAAGLRDPVRRRAQRPHRPLCRGAGRRPGLRLSRAGRAEAPLRRHGARGRRGHIRAAGAGAPGGDGAFRRVRDGPATDAALLAEAMAPARVG